jgi:uncharacterized protein involved in tolerance to divalent cations
MEGRFAALEREVGAIHPCEVPCILRLQAGANRKFGDWVPGEVT